MRKKKRKTGHRHDAAVAFLLALAIGTGVGLSLTAAPLQSSVLTAQMSEEEEEEDDGNWLVNLMGGIGQLFGFGGTSEQNAQQVGNDIWDQGVLTVLSMGDENGEGGWVPVNTEDALPGSLDPEDMSLEHAPSFACSQVGGPCTHDGEGNGLRCIEGMCLRVTSFDSLSVGGGFGEPCIPGMTPDDPLLECVEELDSNGDGTSEYYWEYGSPVSAVSPFAGAVIELNGIPAVRLVVINNSMPLCTRDERWSRPPLSDFVQQIFTIGNLEQRVFACQMQSRRQVACCRPTGADVGGGRRGGWCEVAEIPRDFGEAIGAPLGGNPIIVQAGQSNPCAMGQAMPRGGRNGVLYERNAGTPSGGIACTTAPAETATCGGHYRGIYGRNAEDRLERMCANHPVKSAITDARGERVATRRIWPPSPAGGTPRQGQLINSETFADAAACWRNITTACIAPGLPCTTTAGSTGCCSLIPLGYLQCLQPGQAPGAAPPGGAAGGQKYCQAPGPLAACVPESGDCEGPSLRCCGDTTPGGLRCIMGGGFRTDRKGCCLSTNGTTCDGGGRGWQQFAWTMAWAQALNAPLSFFNTFAPQGAGGVLPGGGVGVPARPGAAGLRGQLIPRPTTTNRPAGMPVAGGAAGGAAMQQAMGAVITANCMRVRQFGMIIGNYMNLLTAGFTPPRPAGGAPPAAMPRPAGGR